MNLFEYKREFVYLYLLFMRKSLNNQCHHLSLSVKSKVKYTRWISDLISKDAMG